MRINGFAGISLIDFPGKISSIIYTSPCNFKCPFCHNASLIDKNDDVIQDFYVISEIKKRKNFIDAVVITGGEPTLQDDLEDFLFKIKDIGLKIKLDTNGYLPEKIKEFINKKLVDYVSMDIKSSKEKYSKACGVNVNLKKILETIEIIIKSDIDYDFRTTCVPELVKKEDIEEISEMINGAKIYILQQYNNENVYSEEYKKIFPYSEKEIEEFAEIAKKYVGEVKINNLSKVF